MTNHTNRPLRNFGPWCLTIAVAALGATLSAQSTQSSSVGVTVYTDANFGGKTASYRLDTPNVGSTFNDKISSIRIPSGETWEVCQDADYVNQCQALTSDVADLRSIGWNDRISSVRRVNNNSNNNNNGRRSSRGFDNGQGRGPENRAMEITIYADWNYGGESTTLRVDTANLVPSGWNDKISSVRIPSGETWEVCEDVDYGRHCQTLTGDVADLHAMGWNDRISSLRRVNTGRNRDQNRDQQSLLFFNQSGFTGASTIVTGTPSTVAFSARQGSVQLRGGGTWELCDRSGRCKTIDQNVSDVSQLGLNGRIATARIVEVSQNRQDR